MSAMRASMEVSHGPPCYMSKMPIILVGREAERKVEMRYWYGQGRHQKIYERLQAKLVPDEGSADTEAGEIIRVVGNVVYDVGNNGGCNFDSGRKDDLEAFTIYLKGLQFEQADELHEQLAGLAEVVPDRHCETRDCVDDFKQYPPLDEKLFDLAVDALVMDAERKDRRKGRKTSQTASKRKIRPSDAQPAASRGGEWGQ